VVIAPSVPITLIYINWTISQSGLQAGQFDSREYPVNLDDITGTELAFKVKIQAKGKLASVLTYKTDPEIIQHLKDQIKLCEVTFIDNSNLSILLQIKFTYIKPRLTSKCLYHTYSISFGPHCSHYWRGTINLYFKFDFFMSLFHNP
jgi:hypothetical protein